jgi:hypothetical protein
VTSTVYLTTTAADGDVTAGSDTKKLAAFTAGASAQLYNKNTVAGATAGIQFTDGTVAGTDGTAISWYSKPLRAVTIAGAVTSKLWAKESATTANSAVTVKIERCTNDGSVVSTIAAITPSQGGAELATTAGGATVTCTVTAGNVTDTTLVDGDRLRISVWLDDAADQGGTGNMASGKDTQIWVNGANGAQGQSEIAFTETLVEHLPRRSIKQIGPFNWYAARLETAFVNNDPVGTATDFGSDAHNATQATGANKPTYKTNIKNGQPAFYFDGGDYLDSSSGLVSSATQTCFAVVNFDSVAADRTIIGSNGSGGTEFKLDFANTRMHLNKENTSVMNHTSVGSIAAATWYILSFDLNGTIASSMYVNGANDTVSPSLAALTAARTLSIGANRNGAAATQMLGYIAELVTFNTQLSASDDADVISELADVYAFTGATGYIPWDPIAFHNQSGGFF